MHAAQRSEQTNIKQTRMMLRYLLGRKRNI